MRTITWLPGILIELAHFSIGVDVRPEENLVVFSGTTKNGGIFGGNGLAQLHLAPGDFEGMQTGRKGIGVEISEKILRASRGEA